MEMPGGEDKDIAVVAVHISKVRDPGAVRRLLEFEQLLRRDEYSRVSKVMYILEYLHKLEVGSISRS